MIDIMSGLTLTHIPDVILSNSNDVNINKDNTYPASEYSYASELTLGSNGEQLCPLASCCQLCWLASRKPRTDVSAS